MRLREALSALSKSSPYAVTTEGNGGNPEFQAIKDYLYVETDIERAFRHKLESIRSSEIIFLCGSSGDGKSEILTRYSQEYGSDIDFHLDATHSFDPSATAIDTLNEIFFKQRKSARPLVVGINIGMLANYQKDGNREHGDIRKAIDSFLENGESGHSRISFLDFEAFPKFTLNDGRISSSFFSQLLDRIVVDDQRNRFRDYLNNEISAGTDPVLVSNYLMLRDKHVQKVIIELLFNARIRQDQFVTARMLLDFAHNILTADGYLFDNLFAGGDNELAQVIQSFDPAMNRSRDLDFFIMNQALGIDDSEFDLYRQEMYNKYNLQELAEPVSAVRLLYLTRNTELANNYPANFRTVFDDRADRRYRKLWQFHQGLSDNPDYKREIRSFYNDVVFAAISRYANKSAPYLSKDEFYLSSHGRFDLASEIELSVNYKGIQKQPGKDIHSFNLHLCVNESNLKPFPMNINLLGLMLDVIDGYHPNKYDKNSVVLLDELVSQVAEYVGGSDTLYLFKDGMKDSRVKLKENHDDEIRVSGL